MNHLGVCSVLFASLPFFSSVLSLGFFSSRAYHLTATSPYAHYAGHFICCRHVANCARNPQPGELFSTLAEFNRVQNTRRVQQLRVFFTSHVAADDRRPLLQAIRQDLLDLGIANFQL
jgi:hypothetical protein